ncbi:DNA polymerase III, subunit gamma and tau [Candidatus Curtissbacteria bacterium RBG_13_35_7]|uniref:DNA polymerase III subunit gamma/tau n=1 Tax=Candidatus Curtissbacteria bacterium RBG_13_35_7 TaxID=1797705 RepID=A0A1F5G359_9BACT|nr:MAG: DNA polymerase III, subunit gamma and tau [Candidatus Curtissbacteria bacterium RBG_13_35_7]
MTVFYRTYRPQKLAELIGQEIIAKTLLEQLETGKFGHAYLFYGPKGTGKTSTARILAKAVNCKVYSKKQKVKSKKLAFGEPCNKCISCVSILDGSHLDLIEIDAASNRGIDEIRDLREKIKLSPVSGKFKVYIIDEAHMLTTEAFNALLKTLEEPPAHAIFILCTTEVGKLPATIVSRLQKFHFQRAKKEDLIEVIEKIAKAEGKQIEKEAALKIAEIADGSYRDAVSIFDQISSKKNKIAAKDVVEIAKLGGWNQLHKFCVQLAGGKLKEAVLLVDRMANEGADVSFFIKQTIVFLEKLLFLKIGISEHIFDDYGAEQIEKMKELAVRFDRGMLQNLIRLLLVAESEIRIYPYAKIPLILAICKFIGEDESVSESVNESKTDESFESVSNKQQEISDKQSLRSSQVAGLMQRETRSVSEAKRARNEKQETGDKSNREENSDDELKVENIVTGNMKGNKKSLVEIEKNWNKFLNKVRPINAHVVALLRATRPVGYDGSNLTMEVFYRFHKERLEDPKIIKMLDTAMEEVINKDVKLRFVLASRQTRPPRVVAKSDVIEIKEDQLEKMAHEIFQK